MINEIFVIFCKNSHIFFVEGYIRTLIVWPSMCQVKSCWEGLFWPQICGCWKTKGKWNIFVIHVPFFHGVPICYVRLFWSVIFELHKFICVILPLYLYSFKRKNYSTVNSLCLMPLNNFLHTIICPWNSLRRFNI